MASQAIQLILKSILHQRGPHLRGANVRNLTIESTDTSMPMGHTGNPNKTIVYHVRVRSLPYIYIYIYIHTYIHTNSIHGLACKGFYTGWLNLWRQRYVCSVCVCIYTESAALQVYIHMHACIYVFKHVYVCVYTYIYICTHMHTYTCTKTIHKHVYIIRIGDAAGQRQPEGRALYTLNPKPFIIWVLWIRIGFWCPL